jgi:hypothetical protein
MIDFVAYLAAQQATERLSGEARPDAPVCPARSTTDPAALLISLRRQISLTLRQMADRVEPASLGCEPVVAGNR